MMTVWIRNVGYLNPKPSFHCDVNIVILLALILKGLVH